MPVRMLVPKVGEFGGVPHRLEKETRVSEDAGKRTISVRGAPEQTCLLFRRFKKKYIYM